MNNIDDLKKYNHIHFIGIGGVSMSAIAEKLHTWNYKVTGSDITSSQLTDTLISNGIEVTIGHDLENPKKCDLIVYSSAIKEDDPEMLLAKEYSIPTINRGKFLGYITKLYKETICVSGTHGKTTTTSMLSICFLNANKDPSIEVGAILKNIGGNYRIGNSEYFILESCEYKANFLNFFPKTEIILNIDNDHLDFYKTFDNVVKAFQDFSLILDENGLLVTNADDVNCYNLKNIVKSKFISYGIENPSANFVAKNIIFDDNGFAKFDVYKNNSPYHQFQLSVAGKHNILNALACIAVCDYYNINKNIIFDSLKSFTGAERRLEFKGKFNDVSIFDDYAHHPTEIIATLNAIKNKKYNQSWVVFQPHTYSRTSEHLENFAKSLLGFDNIILVDIYAAREVNTIGISSNDLVNKIKSLGKEAIYIPTLEEAAKYVKENATTGDLILSLGAGTITHLSEFILK